MAGHQSLPIKKLSLTASGLPLLSGNYCEKQESRSSGNGCNRQGKKTMTEALWFLAGFASIASGFVWAYTAYIMSRSDSWGMCALSAMTALLHCVGGGLFIALGLGAI